MRLLTELQFCPTSSKESPRQSPRVFLLAFSFEPDPATSADYSSSPPQAAYDGNVFRAPRGKLVRVSERQ